MSLEYCFWEQYQGRILLVPMWKMLAKLSTQKLPTNYTEKKVLLEHLHVVLWDYYQFVERTNSTDKGILEGTPNDIVGFVRKNPTITKIAINGYGKYKEFGEKLQNQFGQSIKVFRLPETSGLNASRNGALCLNYDLLKL